MSSDTSARITEQAVVELRARIGQQFVSADRYLTVATRDAIRHWAYGIGDDNPLWLNPEYAARSRWGRLIAPPTMLFAFEPYANGGYAGGLPGIHAFFGGIDWEWHRPLMVDEEITTRVVFTDLIERQSRFAARSFQQRSEVTFFDRSGATIAVGCPYCFRTERGTARDRGKYSALEPASYAKEELDRIGDAYAAEQVRGAEPRFWESVVVGEQLPAIVKGPLTTTDEIAFEQGWGGIWIRSHKRAFEYNRRHPAAAPPNSAGIPDSVERVHWDSEFARAVGVPAAYDYGPERVSWLAHLVTNWMGDDGFLKRLSAQIRRFNLLGDTTWCRGKVVDKSRDGDEATVELELSAQDQRGETTAIGWAAVVLPRANP